MNVANFTEGEYAEEWDLEGLVDADARRSTARPTMTVEELREKVDVISREALTEEFAEDALDTYTEREECFGANPETDVPLMREIERFVVLQVVDTRWREHLESMDYLREGIHLRAMAQKDPLVEYRGEGHAMFEELGRLIREEVVLTLFHVELAPPRTPPSCNPSRAPRTSSTRTTRRPAPTRSPPPASSRVVPRSSATALAEPPPQHQVVNDHRDLGRNDPCWCGSGKKFKRCHGA